MFNKTQRRQKEGGNVLFLILIAVALFAALSYVVTQSTRSGSGNTDKEKALLSSAQMTQYPTSLRTALIRMVLGGVDITQVRFNPPTAFSASTNLEVFHPVGGGATFQSAPSDLMANSSMGIWTFNAEFSVPGIGTESPAAGSNEVVAFLSGVTGGVCAQVNKQLGIDVTNCTATPTAGVPQAVTAVTSALIATNIGSAYSFPTGTTTPVLQCAGTGTAFTRQASGCFYDLAGTKYVFYSVLLER